MANVSPAQQNMIGRQLLLQTGISSIKRLPITRSGLGQQVKIPLQRMGIMTGVLLQFTVPVTIATAAAVPSSRGPWNLAQQVKYTDFAGVDRTRTNGYQLWAAQSMKQGDALSLIPAHAAGSPTLNYDTNITRVPTATGDGELMFSVYVPMAYDPASDLTGAVLTATNVGEHYITVTLPQALASADEWAAPYRSGGGAGTVALTSGEQVSIEAYQFYIQPQNMSAEALPLLDLSTIYGFEGNYQMSGTIAANQRTFVNYPNNRAVFSALIDFQNGNGFTANGGDISQITLMANSNTNFREMGTRMLREQMRNMLNADLPTGSYYLSHRRQPILTQLYANVQAAFDVSFVAPSGVTQMISQYEVQYPSGAPLPGITVQA